MDLPRRSGYDWVFVERPELGVVEAGCEADASQLAYMTSWLLSAYRLCWQMNGRGRQRESRGNIGRPFAVETECMDDVTYPEESR